MDGKLPTKFGDTSVTISTKKNPSIGSDGPKMLTECRAAVIYLHPQAELKPLVSVPRDPK